MINNSYITKLFIVLSIILCIIAVSMNTLIYKYANETISKEIIELNSSVLEQVSEEIYWNLDDTINLSNRIAYDSYIIESLRLSSIENTYKEEINLQIENIIKGNIWSRNRQKNLIETNIITYDGKLYGTPRTEVDIEDILNSPVYTKNFGPRGDAILLNTVKNPDKNGIYRYAFQIIKEIRDHITLEPYGVIIINISENVLYHTYSDIGSRKNDMRVINKDGVIVSYKDKRLIGSKYLEEINLTEVLKKQKGNIRYIRNNEESLIFFNNLRGTSWYIAEEVKLDEILKPAENIRLYVIYLTSISILIFLFLSMYFARKINQPIKQIRNKMESVTKGDLDVRAEIKTNDEFGHIATSFNEMVDRIKYLLDAVKEEETKKRLAELDFLRAQINPHFIYNTLSSIRFYVEMNKNEQAEEMLFLFSRILRQTLTRSDQFITVQDEINTIKDYVGLQKLRYTDSFDVIYDISDEVNQCLIPTFILQPIVENSIFYGVSQQVKGLISVIGTLEDENLILKISDSGSGMSKEQIDKIFQKDSYTSKVGLINVHERIQLNFGSLYGLNIESEEDRGTTITFNLPAKFN